MDKQQKDKIQRIIKVLKVEDFSYLLGRTNHGDLHFRLKKGEEDGVFTLDSVPVEPDVNHALLNIIL